MTRADAQRIADSILAGHRRSRRNTRCAITIGVIMLVLLMIVVVGALVGRQTDGRPSGGSRTGEAQIFARLLGGSSGTARVFVSDRFCDGLLEVETGKRGSCLAGPIPASLQRQIRTITGTRVVFTGQLPQPGPSVVVHFGTALIVDDHAAVAYDVNCGPLCGSGETALLTRVDGDWVRTGTGKGYQWIS